LTEQGIRNIQISEWISIFAPAKTASAITTRLSAAVRAGLSQPDLMENFGKYAAPHMPRAPEEPGRMLKASYDFRA